MSNNNPDENLLERVLENRFYAGAVYDYEDLSKFIKHSSFPDRAKEFKRELADAISNHTISIQEFEDLTQIDYESQEEVDEFLKTEIWQPLYGDEPITRQQAA